MDKPENIKIIVSGGGTGGHIFPALAIAKTIKKRYPESHILFVGAEGRMEMEKVPLAGFEIVGLPVAGFDRKRLWRNVGVLIKLFRSMQKARRIVRTFRPDAAIGVGGYASGPLLKAAQRKNIPTLIQEQNSYAGVTNKLLASKAKAICTAYPDMERFFPAAKIRLTGNPVRSELFDCELTKEDAKEQLGFNPHKKLVFITGGSLGARTINESVIKMLPLVKKEDIQLLWQTGKLYSQRCAEIACEYENIKATPFIENMAIAYRAADIVVARAGACTISELQLLGKPSILIPSPNVAEDHQRKNAEALSKREAAIMIPDKDAEQVLGNQVISLIRSDDKINWMSKKIREMALEDSDNKIVDTLIEII